MVLNLSPSAVNNPPNFMTLLNPDVPEVVLQNPIMQSLQRVLARGNKMLTGQVEENLDMMLTKLLIHELGRLNIKSVACRLTGSHTLQRLPTINQLINNNN